MSRILSSLLLVAVIAAGCATPDQPPGPGAERRFHPVGAEVNGLEVTLTRLSPTLSHQPEAGWWEYELSLANRGPTPVAVRDVKLLTASGRYLQPARSYGETQAAPNVGASVAGDVATGAAGMPRGSGGALWRPGGDGDFQPGSGVGCRKPCRVRAAFPAPSRPRGRTGAGRQDGGQRLLPRRG